MIKEFKVAEPLPAGDLSVIRAVSGVVSGLGIDALIVGAMARIIFLTHVFKLPYGRATTDIDFAVVIRGWDDFQRLKARLVATGAFQEAPHAVHRMTFQQAGSPHASIIDLIPCGEVESHGAKIAWPPDMSIIMNVAGYQDAYRAAVHIELEPGLRVAVASIAGMALLKFFAWVDRRASNYKDAQDLYVLLRRYCEAGNFDRVYEEASLALERMGYDIDVAGAWLLGRDTRATASPENAEALQTLLSDHDLMEQLIIDMCRGLVGERGDIYQAQALLAQFQDGFLHEEPAVLN